MLALPFRFDRPVLALDLETTGKHPKLARIVQIGCCYFGLDGSAVPFKTLINPGVPIPAEATEIHGITDAMVADAPPFKHYAPSFARKLPEVDILGFNGRYDLKVVVCELRRCSFEVDIAQVRVLDAHRLWQVLVPRTLADAVRFWLGREPRDAHQADADIADTIDVLTAQTIQRADVVPDTAAGIHELCWPRDPTWIDSEGKLVWEGREAVFTFGKHAGTPLRSAPRDYLRWVLGKDFSDDLKRIVMSAMQGVYPIRSQNNE